ncbi:FlaD/FlaE family flagellar protein [Halalkaliarchaeum sp. AArc-CO]|uniref:FlaD/FlaE family flagellar protein n=1 Tax=Halalkaliarchaeum sp. AArc-CO TaxID=2866381 RepID=UPI00217EE9CB|nr:FlaD/FlaE family flagellar protein [Halalkaliarchaeum sp. AArc-CO]
MGIETPVVAAPTVAWLAATLGLVGASILDRLLDGEDGDDGDGDPLGDDGGFGDDGLGGDDLGGDGLGGDEFGDGLGGEFDDFDDGLGGEFDEEGADTDELENRLDELENEVATLSSTVSTVRSENEEISETVENIEEDVRNLLDIYEMVTRGINPFVDDEGFDGAGGGGGDFGLFDDAGAEEEAEELDESVAGAEADEFFDESVVEPDDELDDELDDALGDDLDEESDTTDSDTTETDMNDEGKSFSELKEEYDAGEADWADDVGAEDDPADGADADDEVSVEPIPNEMEEESEPAFETEPEPDPQPGFESEPEPEPEPEPDPQAGPEPESKQDPRSSPAGQGFDPENGRDPAAAGKRNRRRGEDGFEYVSTGGMANQEKPYLTSLPGDYVGDLVVMEWLEFLVSNADVTDAVRAVNYYERIEWITPEVAEGLREFLSGFGRVDLNLVDQPGTDVLTREHHTQSLRYIMQLNGATAHSVLLDRWDELGSGAAFGGPGAGGGSSASGGARSGNGAGQSEPHAGGWGDGH